MGKFVDLTGQRFGRLVVKERAEMIRLITHDGFVFVTVAIM